MLTFLQIKRTWELCLEMDVTPKLADFLFHSLYQINHFLRDCFQQSEADLPAFLQALTTDSVHRPVPSDELIN